MTITRRLFGHRLLVSSFPATTTSTRVLHTLFRKPRVNSSIYIGRVCYTPTFRKLSHRFADLKCISSVSSSERNGSVELDRNDDRFIKNASVATSIPVKTFFFSTSVDLRSLVKENMSNLVRTSSRMANYVLLRFGDLKPGPNGSHSSLAGNDRRYMVVFRYGSIVLFNVHDHEIDGYLKIIQGHALGLLPEMNKDEYEVREDANLNTWMEGGLDYIRLQYLDTDGICTIGSVLGQSIALDYYDRQADGMLAEFIDINVEMEKTGNFKMKTKKLFQLVGKGNLNLFASILKLGRFKRSDIAWKNAKYAQILEYLRDEFELTERFDSLESKLNMVENNVRFLLESRHNRKSSFGEGIIILLIGAEILISIALHYNIAF